MCYFGKTTKRVHNYAAAEGLMLDIAPSEPDEICSILYVAQERLRPMNSYRRSLF
jgi:hypothetical protein